LTKASNWVLDVRRQTILLTALAFTSLLIVVTRWGATYRILAFAGAGRIAMPKLGFNAAALRSTLATAGFSVVECVWFILAFIACGLVLSN